MFKEEDLTWPARQPESAGEQRVSDVKGKGSTTSLLDVAIGSPQLISMLDGIKIL